MAWAKISASLHRNPKVRMAGRDAREVYLLMLLANADLSADGELPGYYAELEYIADALQCSVEDASRGLKRCETFQLLHVTHLDSSETTIVTIVGWDSEWRVKKSSDRVRKHRERKRKQEVTPDETPCNVSPVTGNARNALEEKRREEKRVSSALAASQPTKPPAKRAQTLSASWLPTEKHATLAAELGVGVNSEADRFRDHFAANGKAMKDWDASFRNWLRRSTEFRGTAKSSQDKPRRDRELT